LQVRFQVGRGDFPALDLNSLGANIVFRFDKVNDKVGFRRQAFRGVIVKGVHLSATIVANDRFFSIFPVTQDVAHGRI
jgi:hypothetical protein